jgi:uncharacterized membrane protein YkoI
MKKIIVLLSVFMTISLFGFTVTVTHEEVPAAVKKTFEKKFSNATDAKYVDSKKYYQVTFKSNGDSMSANFNSKGEWIKTETQISNSDLPNKVNAAVAAKFAGFTVTGISQTDTPDKKLIYNVILKKDAECYLVRFSPGGDVLKKLPVKK